MLYGAMFAWLQCLREYFPAHLVWPCWVSPWRVPGRAGSVSCGESPCCHQGMSPSCSTPRAALVLHLSFLGSQNPVAGPSACSRCVEQRVGGAAVLLQLQWQQGRVGSHPRVFGPLLSFWYLLKISWGLFFWNWVVCQSPALVGGFAEGVSDPAEPRQVPAAVRLSPLSFICCPDAAFDFPRPTCFKSLVFRLWQLETSRINL